MKKKCRVVMLPAEKASELFYHPNGKSVHLSLDGPKNKDSTTEPQHLYIISDDDIEKGDLYIFDRRVRQCEFEKDLILKGADAWKVIASTDPSLRRTEDEGIIDIAFGEEMPHIPQSFIEVYVKANGEIDEVLVECEEKSTGFYKCSGCGNRLHFINESDGCDKCGSYMEEKEVREVLKLRENNTVTVCVKVGDLKEKDETSYSKKDVIAILIKYFNHPDGITDEDDLNKFIEENL